MPYTDSCKDCDHLVTHPRRDFCELYPGDTMIHDNTGCSLLSITVKVTTKKNKGRKLVPITTNNIQKRLAAI